MYNQTFFPIFLWNIYLHMENQWAPIELRSLVFKNSFLDMVTVYVSAKMIKNLNKVYVANNWILLLLELKKTKTT